MIVRHHSVRIFLVANILLHILLPGLDCALAQLHTHLRRGIIHEAPECRVHVVAPLTLRWALVLLPTIAIASML